MCKESVIIERTGYDKDGHTVYVKLGNGTETEYTNDDVRQRLQEMNLTSSGSDIMRNKYQYDAVDNILGISNTANPQSIFENKAKLGGSHIHSYQYDELNRLIHAMGKAKSASYDMAMTFNSMSMPMTKFQNVDSTATATSYHNIYRYEDSNHPTAPTQIGHDHYEYDANGNPTLVTNDSLNMTRELYWDEDNRLMVLSDNGKTSRYTYNHAGERIVKSHGDMEGVYINGAPQGITFHETDEYTLYPASIISVNKNRFTKHYFIGDKRVASRIGSGKFNNVYGRNGSYVTAGQQDYAERMNQIESQKEDYYKELGIAPGVPTMKGAYGDPENTGVGYNTIITELGDHSVPEAWAQYAKHNDKEDSAPGAPIAWDDPVSPEEPEAGYGYVADDSAEPEETFFYHSDHLGSTSYITDDKGNITQYDAYLPYGELLVDEHSSSEEMPYKFNGKELDEETGLYYYGARYMQPVASIWYGVDAEFEKSVSRGSYVYCNANPIRLVDPDGNFPHLWQARLSRWFHNLLHKTKAGPIHTHNDVKDSRFRYTYDTYSSTSNGEFVITANYKFDKKLAQIAQDAGDGIALAGYAATITGVGAEVGAPVAAIGNTISNVGAVAEIGLDAMNGDVGNSVKGVIYYIAEKGIEKGIDKVMPGNAGPRTKDVAKSLKDKVTGETTGKSILSKDFDLGKSIVSQSAGLKAILAEKAIDTAINKDKE